ncbi:MAG: hypothetical protein H0V75_07985 [Rubrobacter sp.]|jgi:hypothetical protein|nr:hypothetical protein [Rubrobacter sp.]
MIIGIVAGAAALVVLIAAIAVGCGGSSGDEASGNGSGAGNDAATTSGGDGETNGTTAEGTGGGQSEGEENTEGEGTESAEAPERPYAALEPAADTEPLSENVSEDYMTQILGAEAGVADDQYAAGEQYGEEDGEGDSDGPERSVPLGEMLLEGEEDAADGPIGENRIVAYYGTPMSELMGILGEAEPEVVMEQLIEQTQAYSDADPERPAIPMIEFIASIAQRDPGPEGLYIGQTDPEVIEEYVRLAEENDALLMLDVQLGRASVMDEIEILEDFLMEPHVHLAIDTEYSIDEGQVPGVDLGTVEGAEIQEAVEYLDELVERENLPDKLLMVHQFEQEIVTDKEAIQPTENVQVALHADGFGTPEAKFSKYGTLVRDQPIQYGGFKVFYQQDTPVLEPEQVLALDPAPAVITYQ